MEMISLSNYSANRMQKLIDTLKRMHAAKVLHMDLYPRNMVIVPGAPGRALLLDFDRAQTYDPGKPLPPREQEWLEEEVEIMEYFAKALVGFMICISADQTGLTVALST